ncbi:DUF2971 domain-containing protein [Oceanicoccus sagamiensis]|uniref:DUF2971 domain-containing protein n=1 Tax=Oceanicoccus sagamiensis TaxID=716816 RepID=UPI000A271FB3|nr:DUF2971 domain-containing protein [Oceanicoccus sagamiensis]
MADEIASLVKFCTAETGLKVLNSQSLRWSAPHLFNDPFELSHKSEPDFTPDTLLKGMIKEAVAMLFGPSDPTGKSNRLVAAVARWREEDRFGSEEEATQVLNQLLSQIATQQQEGIDTYMSAWRQFSRSLRICCFSDKPNNMDAWQRYGENHAGVALRFSAGDDTALPNPKRVTYSQVPPLVTSLKQQVAVTYGKETAPSPDSFLEKMLNKSKSNNVEREWRCFSSEEPDAMSDESLWYANKQFSAPELKAVYFGLGTSRTDKDNVIKLIKEKYKSTKVYQAVALPNRYEIDFVQLATK